MIQTKVTKGAMLSSSVHFPVQIPAIDDSHASPWAGPRTRKQEFRALGPENYQPYF